MAESSSNKLLQFFKNWLLVIGIITGAGAYLLYHAIPALHPAGPVMLVVVKKVQPALLFLMLFLSFCKIRPAELKPHRWQARMLAIQCVIFVLTALLVAWSARGEGELAAFVQSNRATVEAFMLCMICPTATACAVMTGKLGGNMAEVVTYTVIINLAVAILVPLMLPMLYPDGGVTFSDAFLRILAKVFPLLIMPCLSAWLIRWLIPSLHKWLLGKVGWSFYLWGVGLTLAILMSTRAIVQYEGSAWVLAGIAVASLLACVLQFWAGRVIGRRCGSEISASQALGQKNTVFAIWLGYTFMDPIVSVAGGFYSIWHNVWNSWQLYRKRQRDEAAAKA